MKKIFKQIILEERTQHQELVHEMRNSLSTAKSENQQNNENSSSHFMNDDQELNQMEEFAQNPENQVIELINHYYFLMFFLIIDYYIYFFFRLGSYHQQIKEYQLDNLTVKLHLPQLKCQSLHLLWIILIKKRNRIII